MKAYKFKIRRPSQRVVADFQEMLDLCRELYNAALQERRDAWRIRHKSINYFDQSAQLKFIRQDRPDIGRFYCNVFGECLRRAGRTYDAFFLRCRKGQKPGFPRFKGGDRYNSFTYRKDGFKLNGDRLILSKLGSVRLRLSRPVEGTIKTVMIKRQADGWFAILTVEEHQSPWYPRTGDNVGIDVGIENLATLAGRYLSGLLSIRSAQLPLGIRRLQTSGRTSFTKQPMELSENLTKLQLKI